MKCSFFQAAVVSILLYGCTTWTVIKRMEKRLDGNYTRILRVVLNKSWTQHPTKHLSPKLSKLKRIRHPGHCWRSRDKFRSDILLWTPSHGRVKAGRLARTYIPHLCADTECSIEDLPRATDDRDMWRQSVRDINAGFATWWWWWWIIEIKP